MYSRRSFLKKAGHGAAFTAMAVSAPMDIAAQFGNKAQELVKPLTIGIIGAENSHTATFGQLFNVQKAFPGVEVKYVWGETEAFAKTAMEKGNIPHMVKDPSDMLGKIDALIVDHRHGKFHLKPAIPFIEAKIPTFIDKPFCYRVAEGKEFLALARKMGTPVTSFSAIAHSLETFAIKEKLLGFGEIGQVVRYGPLDLDSPYGGVFFYGPHMVDPLLYIFGDLVHKVRVHQNGANSSASMVFKNGMLATLVFTTKKYGWETHVETKEGINALEAPTAQEGFAKNNIDMVEMFRKGIEPRSHESILYGVAVLEALERSVASQQWEMVDA